eukprot:6130106-Pleurochrysis_carterae.AAC.7
MTRNVEHCYMRRSWFNTALRHCMQADRRNAVRQFVFERSPVTMHFQRDTQLSSRRSWDKDTKPTWLGLHLASDSAHSRIAIKEMVAHEKAR